MDTTVKTTKKKNSNLRHWFQAASVALSNGYAYGWANGKIFTGSNKQFCLPGLNCYSCPGAVAACPIGSLQAVLDSGTYKFSLYVFGIIGFLGMIFGRFICGWMCPFGFFQDLLYKIPFFKKVKNLPGHKYAIYLKYVILLVFVIILPMTILNAGGVGQPWFCEYICPSGLLLGGIPLTASNPNLAAQIGPRFIWKLAILILVIVLSIISYRPFCKYVCPLGALYGFCNPVASHRMRVDKEKCVSCGMCQKACGMDIKVWQNPNSMECIRCGKCRQACPTGAITTTWGDWKRGMTKPDPQPAEASVELNAESAAAPVKAEAKRGTNIFAKILGIGMIASAGYTLYRCGFTLYVYAVYLQSYIEDVSSLFMMAQYIIPMFCATLLLILGFKMIFSKDDVRVTHQLNWITLGSVGFAALVLLVFAFFCLGVREENLLTAFIFPVSLIVMGYQYFVPLIVLTILGAIATKSKRVNSK